MITHTFVLAICLAFAAVRCGVQRVGGRGEDLAMPVGVRLLITGEINARLWNGGDVDLGSGSVCNEDVERDRRRELGLARAGPAANSAILAGETDASDGFEWVGKRVRDPAMVRRKEPTTGSSVESLKFPPGPAAPRRASCPMSCPPQAE
jgi:hypothetical protein